ncbi:lipoprotein [Enterobacterales bacterium]|nr:lipoprotein [Enterobacterales bacterium]
MPLLFITPRLVAALLVLSLVGCSSLDDTPRFTASGYVADQGINRLWRLDDAQHLPQTIVNVYSPYHGGDTVITRYEYQQGQLHLMRQTHAMKTDLGVMLRFDNEGNVSFMQRQLPERREKLSSDDIELYKYQASKLLNLSNTLRAGNVQLVQGQWKQGVITSCSGQPVTLSLSIHSQVWLAKRASRANDHLGLAWLTAPEGDELLLVANEDFCKWEPKESDL